jgi:hypothetical protein
MPLARPLPEAAAAVAKRRHQQQLEEAGPRAKAALAIHSRSRASMQQRPL